MSVETRSSPGGGAGTLCASPVQSADRSSENPFGDVGRLVVRVPQRTRSWCHHLATGEIASFATASDSLFPEQLPTAPGIWRFRLAG
jgi:hypothetical protein